MNIFLINKYNNYYNFIIIINKKKDSKKNKNALNGGFMYTIDKIIKRFNSIFLKINNNHKPNDCINKKII